MLRGAWYLLGLAALLGVVFSAVPARAETGTDRYYVVGPPVDGQGEYLFGIAAQTLGDGNRYPEIFALNEGRPQPGGGRLTDPMDVEPGWILVLPADASGPGVHIGEPPPIAMPASSGPASPGPAPVRAHAAVVLYPAGIAVVLAGAGLALWARRRLAAAPAPVPASADPGHSPAGPEIYPAEVVALLDTGAVRLSGRAGRGGDAFGWRAAHEPPLDGALPVVLGERDGWLLWADLARVPDLLAVSGAPDARRRYAAGLAAQLDAAGRGVAVVDGALGADAPAGARVLDGFPAAGGVGGPGVVISGELPPGQLVDARSLAERTGRDVVAVVVGDVPRASWSVAAADLPKAR
ncbi:LysM peptidoglycan-binding domain-containing protein [Dactylosporangium sp. CA-139066]|uniref:LysM peptidoglycan-binding domain-containing protein n=1 Tax=Dactylosporangium sp. CA-139066 TaxID=3239930 RepID=UPI003D91645B